jgi:hypothetical protein
MSQTGSKADPALQLPDANADKQNHPPEHENSEAGWYPAGQRS